MPATTHPYNGDVEVAFINVLPVLKKVFSIPICSSAVDQEYRKHLLENPLKAEFYELVEDPQLLDKWIDEMEAVGTKEGKPRYIQIDHQTPTYKMTNTHTRQEILLPKTKACHPRLKKVRGVSHSYAIKQLLKLGLVPFIVTQNQRREKVRSFGNINRVLYTYYVYYCFAEGLTILHDEAT